MRSSVPRASSEIEKLDYQSLFDVIQSMLEVGIYCFYCFTAATHYSLLFIESD
jgi:hypothetical protein